MSKTMSANIQTELAQLELQIREGRYNTSSPRYVAQHVERAISTDLDTAFGAGRSDTEADLKVVHYTSLANTIAMLKPEAGGERYLRMYSAIGFNDPSEGDYFTQLAREHSEQMKSLLSTDAMNSDPAFIASFIRTDQSNDDQLHSINSEDNLSFWRAYGREGAGCSLKLSISGEVKDVVYGDQATIESVEAVDMQIENIFASVESVVDTIAAVYRLPEAALPETLQNGVRDEFLRKEMQKRLRKSRYLYKSLPFQYERECRIVEVAEASKEEIKVNFDFSGAQGEEIVKKYVEHPLLKLTDRMFDSSSVITLGPLVQNKQHTREYMKSLLAEAGFHGTEVRCSKIEYRKPFHR